LTPPSSDGGRDVIAVRKGICKIRIIDQVKAYAPKQRVSANDIRSLIGVLSSDLNVSKGFVTTTAEFAPKIYTDPSINQFIPYRVGCKYYLTVTVCFIRTYILSWRKYLQYAP